MDQQMDEKIVLVMRNANFEKNINVQSHRMLPEATVVAAEPTIETPMVVSAYRTRSPRVLRVLGASTYAFPI